MIPRAPSFTFYETAPFTVDNSTVSFSRSPTNFSFAGNLNLYGELMNWAQNALCRGSSLFWRVHEVQRAARSHTADSSSNYLPVNFKHLQATLYDLDTLKTIATGDWGSHKLPKGDQEPIILPVEFSYSALNQSDSTCALNPQASWCIRADCREPRVRCLWAYMARHGPARSQVPTRAEDVDCGAGQTVILPDANQRRVLSVRAAFGRRLGETAK